MGAKRCALHGRSVSGGGGGKEGDLRGAGRGSEVGPRHVPRTTNETVQVLLGAHSLSMPEPSKRLYDVRSAVRHPGSGPDSIEDDLLLLQVRRPGPSYPLGSTQGLASTLPPAPSLQSISQPRPLP